MGRATTKTNLNLIPPFVSLKIKNKITSILSTFADEKGKRFTLEVDDDGYDHKSNIIEDKI